MAQGSAVNVPYNAIRPFSSQYLATGSAEYIAAEVAVGWTFRRIFNMPRPIAKLGAIHGLSLPLMGGAAGFLDASKDYTGAWGDQVQAGVKGVPAVLLAHYIVQVFQKGFGLPSAGFKEYLVSAVTKILSRPILASVYTYLPNMGQDGLNVLHELIVRQSTASNFSG